MTVAELTEQLKTLAQDLQVVVEGCDCYGWASGAKLQNRTWDIIPSEVVVITRGEEL